MVGAHSLVYIRAQVDVCQVGIQDIGIHDTHHRGCLYVRSGRACQYDLTRYKTRQHPKIIYFLSMYVCMQYNSF